MTISPYSKISSVTKRRGVSVIIGGTIMAAILFTSVLAYFLVVQQTQVLTGESDVQFARTDDQKKQESLSVVTLGPTPTKTGFWVLVNNTGPLPTTANYLIVSKDNDPSKIQYNNTLSIYGRANSTLNPGEGALYNATSPDSVSPSGKYVINLVSSRGNIYSATWPAPAASGTTDDDSANGYNFTDGRGTHIVNSTNTRTVMVNSTITGHNVITPDIPTGISNFYSTIGLFNKTDVKGDLWFYSLKAGNGVSFQKNANGTITVNAPGGTTIVNGKCSAAVNQPLGYSEPSGQVFYSYADGDTCTMWFRSIKGTNGIVASNATNTDKYITIDGSQLVAVGKNLTASDTSPSKIGYVYKNTTAPGRTLNFRTLSGTGGIKVATNATSVTIDGSNVGNGIFTIAQQTGSIQLDFKSYGLLFPDWKKMNGIDQTGWLAKNGNATGYPATMIPSYDRVVIVERMRNLDQTQQPITLARSAGLSIALGKNPSNVPPVVYICGINGTGYPQPYVENTNGLTLTYVDPFSGVYNGFQQAYFCSLNAQTSTTKYSPGTTANINSVFTMLRGFYGTPAAFTNQYYSQTVPYQATFIANNGDYATPSSEILACLETNSGHTSGVACPQQNVGANDITNFVYSATQGQMTTGVAPWLRITDTTKVFASDQPKTFSVSWLVPGSAQSILLRQNQQPVGGYIQLPNLPASTPGDYTLVITSSPYRTTGSDTLYSQDAYYITFEVKP